MDPKLIDAMFVEETSKFTRIAWVDYAGILRTKVVSDEYLDSYPKLAMAGMTLCLNGCFPSEASSTATGEVSLLPPQSTTTSIDKVQIPWCPNHSFTFAEMYTTNGKPWIHCPLNMLRKSIRLLDKYNLKLQAGYELEFALLKYNKEKGTWESWPNVGCMAYASHEMFDIASAVLDDICNTLQKMDITVYMLHAESGIGQFEIVLHHEYVITAVKNAIIAKEVIRTISRKHDLKATFSPKWDNNVIGNGGHVHLSLDNHFNEDNGNIEHEDDLLKDTSLQGIDEIGQSFIAGIVNGLDWIMFTLNSSPLSYERTKPGRWAGSYKTYGINNKETPVRIAEDRSNFEIKVGDGISNPYIGMAAIITAGVIGIEENMQIGRPCQVDPVTLGGMFQRLPEEIYGAMEKFRVACLGSERLKYVFPQHVVQDFIAVREIEARIPVEDLKEVLIKLF